MENTLKEFFYSAEESAVSEYAKRLLDVIENKADNGTLLNEIWDALKKALGSLFALPEWTFSVTAILLIVLGFEIVKDTFKAKAICSALGYCIKLLLASTVLLSVGEIIDGVSVYMQDTVTFLGALAPTVGTLLAAGGNVTAAKTVSVFMTVLLSAFQILLHKAVPLISTVFFGIALTDAASGGSRMALLSQTVKNICYTAFSVFTALYIILLGTQSLAASGTDSFSSRTIKLLVGNTVPIVGGTLGDALKLVGGGFIAVKNNVGTAAVLFLIFMYLPPLIILWLCGIIMNVFLFFCDYFSLQDVKGVFLHVKYALNFVLAAYTSVFVMGMVNIGIFMGCVPAIIA